MLTYAPQITYSNTHTAAAAAAADKFIFIRHRLKNVNITMD